MTVLVTGATGFVGGHLVERLAKEKERIKCLVKRGSDTSLLEKAGAELIYGDLLDKASLKAAVAGVDTVYHLAALARLYTGLTAEDYNKVNAEGTRNLLEACAGKVVHIVYTSSADAVGPSRDGRPCDESTPRRPVNIYGESKLASELICEEYSKKGVPITVIRPPMIYGPRCMLHLKRLFKLVKTGFYPVMGDGQALMEFCYVGNVVAGLILAARSKQAIGRTYYISDERSYTITEVLNAIAKAEGVKLRIIHLPTPVGNAIGLTVETFGKVFRFWPFIVKETGRPTFSRNTVRWSTGNTWICSTEKAKRELGYEPAVSLQEGVQRTVEWYKSVGAL